MNIQQKTIRLVIIVVFMVMVMEAKNSIVSGASTTDRIGIMGENAPPLVMELGRGFTASGVITAVEPLIFVAVDIYDGEGNLIFGSNTDDLGIELGVKKFDIDALRIDEKISALAPGNYTYVVYAMDVSRYGVRLVNKDFIIDDRGFGIIRFLGNRQEEIPGADIGFDTGSLQITGCLHKEVPAGGTIAYKSGVNIITADGSTPSLEVNSNGVNINIPGFYTVIYSAADNSGNTVKEYGTVIVRKIDMELINDMSDDILSQIITPDMSDREKAYEIYNWVSKKVKYSSTNATRELAQGAYICFTKGIGDCFIYRSGSEALLTRAGIQNLEIRRFGGTSDHFWNLINVGDGWYHFDACANAVIPADKKFMFTDSQSREYTRLITKIPKYYEYDKSTVPEIVK